MIPELYPIAFVIASAIATVTIDQLVTNVPPTLILFLVTSIAIVYFHLVNAKKIKGVYQSIFKAPLLSFNVNLSLAVTWWATYLGIHYLGASIYNIFYFSITAILASILTINSKKLLEILLLLIALILGAILMNLPVKGVAISLLGGLAGFSYRKVSFALSKKTDLTSSQVLSIRFWMLWCVLLFVAPVSSISHYLNAQVFLLILLIAFISFILQNWLNQQGIIKAGVRKSTLILSWTPLATLVFQYIIQREFHLNWLILAVICQIILFSIKFDSFSIIVTKLKKRNNILPNENYQD